VARRDGCVGLSPANAFPPMLGSKFKERLSYDDVRTIRGDVADAYAKGDYPFVSRFGAAYPELQGCSFILIGNPRRGLDLLDSASISSEYSQVLRAFAHWYLSEDQESHKILDALLLRAPDCQLAMGLKSLVAGDRPRILFASSRPSVVEAMRKIGGFEVMSVGVPGQDVDFIMDKELRVGSGSAAARSYLERGGIFLQFDLGGPIPSDLGDFPYFRYAYVPDPEMHLANDGDVLRDFDQIITCCSQMSVELEALYGRPTLTLPLFGGLTSLHESVGESVRWRQDKAYLTLPRPIDVLFTGAIATPLYVEKPTRFLAFSQLPAQFDIRLLDRTFSPEVYDTMLGLAKFVPASFRWLDGVGSRTIQALRKGTFVLANEKTALDLYFARDGEGISFFRERSLLEDVAGILESYEILRGEFEANRPQFERRLDELFPPSPIVEQRWLKTLAFLSLQQTPSRREVHKTNRAYGWLTGRAFPRKENLESYFLQDPDAPDYATKELALRASRAVFEGREDVLAEIVRADSDQDAGRPGDLTRELLPAYCSWILGWPEDFVERLQAIWTERGSFQPLDWDALAFFDLKLATWLRRSFVSDALVHCAHISCALAKRGRLPPDASVSPRDVLLSGVGAFLAGRAFEAGDLERAIDLANSALAYAPDNFVAQQVAGKAKLLRWVQGAEAEFEEGEKLWRASVEAWPWFLPEIFPYFLTYPKLDERLLEGNSHEVFLKFVQRVRTDRAHVSDLRIPVCSRGYLRDKLALRIDPITFDVGEVERKIKDLGLRFSEPEFFRRNIVLPLCWDGAVALRDTNPEGAGKVREVLKKCFGDIVKALEIENAV